MAQINKNTCNYLLPIDTCIYRICFFLVLLPISKYQEFNGNLAILRYFDIELKIYVPVQNTNS